MKKAMDLTGKVLVEVNANGEKRQYKTKRWKNIDVAIKEIEKKLKKNHIKSIEHVNFKSKTSDKVVSGMDIVQDYRDSGSTDTLEQYIKKNYIINKKSKKEIEKLKKNKKDKANQDKENKQESSQNNPVKANKQDNNKEDTKEENNQDTQENKQDNKDKEKLDKNKKRRYTQISPEREEELKEQLNEEFEKYYGEYIGKKLETYYGKILITSKIKEHMLKRHINQVDKNLVKKSMETLISPDGGFPTMDKRRNEAWCVYKEYEDSEPVAAFIRNGEVASTYILDKHEKLQSLIERGKENDKKDIGKFLDVE